MQIIIKLRKVTTGVNLAPVVEGKAKTELKIAGYAGQTRQTKRHIELTEKKLYIFLDLVKYKHIDKISINKMQVVILESQ